VRLLLECSGSCSKRCLRCLPKRLLTCLRKLGSVDRTVDTVKPPTSEGTAGSHFIKLAIAVVISLVISPIIYRVKPASGVQAISAANSTGKITGTLATIHLYRWSRIVNLIPLRALARGILLSRRRRLSSLIEGVVSGRRCVHPPPVTKTASLIACSRGNRGSGNDYGTAPMRFPSFLSETVKSLSRIVSVLPC
jgi:hypothetical protein